MKVSLLCFVVACAALVAGTSVPADKTFIKKQWDVFRMLHRVQQHSFANEQIAEAKSYDLEAHANNYHNPKVVKNFMAMYKHGVLLKRGVPFSLYYLSHHEQAVMLFELFYYANDYDTFYKTACWARDKVNEGMFIYSYSVAVIHRSDTQHIKLPPIYEVYPYLFFEDDVVQEAYNYRMEDFGSKEHQKHVVHHNFTIHSEEDEIAYFRDDIALNAFATYYWYFYPFWMNYTKYGINVERTGEQFYYTNQQIFARYLNARLAERLPKVKPFEYELPFKTAFNPKLRYHTGQAVASRPAYLPLSNYDLSYLSDVENYERRVGKLIDLGYALWDLKEETHHSLYNNEGKELLGKIMNGGYNMHYYGILYHKFRSLLGHITDPFHKHDVAPSALQQNEAYLRDPGYYQIWKRIQHYFDRFLKRLPHYTHEELSFDGINIDNVEVGDLYTYFEPHEYYLIAPVHIAKLEDNPNMDIKYLTYRLNHKPFTFKIEMTSDKDSEAYVRVYLGPKYNQFDQECDLNVRRNYFVEIDQFPYHVKAGKNVIERNSHDSSVVAHEEESYRAQYKKILEAHEGKSEYEVDREYTRCGFPEHLLIPKGQKGGQDYVFYVIVSPREKPAEHSEEHIRAFSYCGVGAGHHYPDNKPLGFPFDRPLYSWEFDTPNMFFKDVTIFHKKYEQVTPH